MIFIVVSVNLPLVLFVIITVANFVIKKNIEALNLFVGKNY